MASRRARKPDCTSDLHSPHQCAQKMSGVCAGAPDPGITLPELTRPSIGVDRRPLHYSGADVEPVRGTPSLGAADRRGRRHGRAHLRGRAAAALPGGGEPARGRERRRAARQLHPRRRRADRDEHVRRQPAQAGRSLPRGRVRADQLDRGAPRPGGTGGLGRRRLHRRLDRADRRRRAFRPRRAEPALQRAGADPRGPRRRPAHARDVLRPRRARRRDRGRPRRLVACRSWR